MAYGCRSTGVTGTGTPTLITNSVRSTEMVTAGCWPSSPARTRRTPHAVSTGRTCSTPRRALNVQIDRIRHYANHPGFVQASVDASLKALDTLGERADEARLVFVTHSIPTAMAETAGPAPRSRRGAYVDWHAAVASEVAHRVAQQRARSYDHDLVYCSRSGPASQPWLEPDINDHLRQLAGRGVPAVVVVPIGFVSDHMEVVFDLDTEAAATAEECGMAFARAATAGDHPVFVSGLVDLMVERAAAARGSRPERPVLGSAPVGWYECRADCCPNLREPGRPALCQIAG